MRRYPSPGGEKQQPRTKTLNEPDDKVEVFMVRGNRRCCRIWNTEGGMTEAVGDNRS